MIIPQLVHFMKISVQFSHGFASNNWIARIHHTVSSNNPHNLSHNSIVIPRILYSFLRAIWLFFVGVLSLIGNGRVSHASSVFVFMLYNDVWTNFWLLQKFSTSHVITFRILYLKNDVWVRQSRMAGPNTSRVMFPECLTKNNAIKFCDRPTLYQRNRTWTPKNIVFGMEWTWVGGSTWDFCDAKHNSHKSWKFNAVFLVRYSKSLFRKFLSSRCRSTTQESVYEIKILEDCTWPFLEFSQHSLYRLREVSIAGERHRASL